MARICGACGKKTGILDSVKIKDGYACGNCLKKSLMMADCSSRSSDDFKERFSYLDERNRIFTDFTPTFKVDQYFQINEDLKLFKVGSSIECFPFSELVNFELNEDGETITKGGVGRAVVGSILFGDVGAIVGGVTGGKKSKTLIKSMYIRISLNNKWIKTLNIPIITSETKKGGFTYNCCKSIADKIISLLEIITNSQNQVSEKNPSENPQIGIADEILKFKQLLDTGAISNEEFEEKKQRLLSL